MSFWQTSDGHDATQVGTTYSAQDAMVLMPEGTHARAVIQQAVWSSWEGEDYINLKWVLVDTEFKGRVVFQKIKVRSPEPKKRDRAIMMLAAISNNAGGVLARTNEMPTDQDLLGLTMKPMIITLAQWQINGKKGNWVREVAPNVGGQSQPQSQPQAQSHAPSAKTSRDNHYQPQADDRQLSEMPEDQIPF